MEKENEKINYFMGSDFLEHFSWFIMFRIMRQVITSSFPFLTLWRPDQYNSFYSHPDTYLFYTGEKDLSPLIQEERMGAR